MLEIPNNAPPTPPVAEADVLDSLIADDEWHSSGNRYFKQSYRKNLIRIKLSADFMKEGPNRLGLVLSAVGVASDKDLNVSRFGEDITRLSSRDWSREALRSWIDFAPLRAGAPSEESKTEDALLAKYVDSESAIRKYVINDIKYEVLALVPHFNAKEECWQVVVPFKNLLSSDSFFFKFALLKICNGHGWVEDETDREFRRDETGTNLSAFGEPVQVPVFAKKKTELDYIAATQEYQLLIESQTEEPNKFYAIIGLTKEERNIIINQQTAADTTALKDLGTLTSLQVATAANSQSQTGKILLFRHLNNQRPPVRFKADHRIRRLWILEFETHNNAPQIFDPGVTMKFHSKNIFEENGIRLINMSSFRTD